MVLSGPSYRIELACFRGFDSWRACAVISWEEKGSETLQPLFAAEGINFHSQPEAERYALHLAMKWIEKRLRSGFLSSNASARQRANFSVTIQGGKYRRRVGALEEWHFHPDCPDWPRADYLEQDDTPPRDQICLECIDLHNSGVPTPDLDPQLTL